jgi:hypothetical protein
MESKPAQFPDVATLLERSRPRSRAGWTWYLLLGFLGFGLVSGMGNLPAGVQLVSAVLMLALVVGSGAAIWVALKRFRAEQQLLQAIEELIQLRRWPEAAGALEGLLDKPVRAPAAWVQALIYLASVLSRYHRFADAMLVHDFLLSHVQLDPAGEYGVKLGRAMAMLREEHLLDADRAIAELRKLSAGQESGGLALIEIYRDVKTGHPDEAIEMFRTRSKAMREQLGHRVGDAFAIVARAYDMLGRDDDAQAAWADATVLSPVAELLRRYPEVRPVGEKYAASPVPAGMG